MDQHLPKEILILTTTSFPVGLAGTNRVLSYCKGFLYHGYQPEVYCIRPAEPYHHYFNSSVKGSFDGIKYTYPGGKTMRVASFWGRRKNDLIAKYASLSLLFKALKKGRVCFIIIYGNCITVELGSILLSRLFRISIYKEESENPDIYFRGTANIYNSFKKWFVINKLYSYYSGVLVMTHPLRELFLSKGVPDRKIVVVPQTVDQNRFEKAVRNTAISLPKEYIAYVGSLNQHKDGVLTLIESFSELSSKYPEMHLVIAGDGTQQEKVELLFLIKQMNQTDKIHYIGRIASDDIPAFLSGAKLLASCRPGSIQSDFGFPTKTVEYLASGKPTVTTATGELTFYLEDRVNAFVANNAEKRAFALKITEVMDNYDFAMKVAQNGKELVSDKFSPVTQTRMIIDFYKD
jgi:glycosyltransferase involved in cell wall biosynthesis